MLQSQVLQSQVPCCVLAVEHSSCIPVRGTAGLQGMRLLLWSQACGPDTAQQHVMPTLVLLFFNTASAGGLSGWGLRTSAAACAMGKEKKLKVKTKMFEKRDLIAYRDPSV